MMCWVWCHCTACSVHGAVSRLVFSALQPWGNRETGQLYLLLTLVGTLASVSIAVTGGFLVYGAIKATMGIRLSEEDE